MAFVLILAACGGSGDGYYEAEDVTEPYIITLPTPAPTAAPVMEHPMAGTPFDGAPIVWLANTIPQPPDAWVPTLRTNRLSATGLGSAVIMDDGRVYAWGGMEGGYNAPRVVGDGDRDSVRSVLNFGGDYVFLLLKNGSMMTPDGAVQDVIALSRDGNMTRLGSDGRASFPSILTGQYDRYHFNPVHVRYFDGATMAMASMREIYQLNVGRVDYIVGSFLGGLNYVLSYDGDLWGWGFAREYGFDWVNTWGHLGDGSGGVINETPVFIMADVNQIVMGARHNLALNSEGRLFAWGYDAALGLGENAMGVQRPRSVMTDVSYVSAGAMHTMVIDNDGTLWGFGNNMFGQIGDGTTQQRDRPVEIMRNVAYVAAGEAHTLAITHEGYLYAWGHGEFGQLGDGANENRYSPVRIKSVR